LTATFALRTLLPLIPAEHHPLLLRVTAAVGLTYYIARGRPLLQPSKLPASKYSWDEMTRKTWSVEDIHIPKVIRALKVISEMDEMDAELAKNAAGLVVVEMIDNGNRWSYFGQGFDKAWEDMAQRKESGPQYVRDRGRRGENVSVQGSSSSAL
jgi:Questin oxidase-like